MKKRQLVSLLAAIAILVAGYFLWQFLGSLKEEPQVFTPPKVKKYVKTQPVSYGEVASEIIAYGRVQTAQSLDLLSEVAGRMFQGNVRLKEGTQFSKGTLLFYIDDEEASLNLKSDKSNFLRDLAAVLPDIKIDFSDNYQAWSDYFSSIKVDKDLPELPEVKSEKEKTFMATKGIYSSFYTIKSSESRLKKYRYYAPFAGSISEVAMESGAYISPGTKIGTIMRSSALELKVSVTTKDIPWVQMGVPVKVAAEDNQFIFEGEVVRISDYVNQNTQSVDVYVRLDAKDFKIYDGQFFEAVIPARKIENGMIIPRDVLYSGNEVFVLEDTLLKSKPVQIYRLLENEAIIGGLAKGEQLVVEPLVNATDNMTAFALDQKELKVEQSAN